MELGGKVAVVTGAASGVGRALADRCARGDFWILPESPDTDAKVRARVDSILERTAPPLPFP